MSLWICQGCKSLTAFTASMRCPSCGGQLEFATVDSLVDTSASTPRQEANAVEVLSAEDVAAQKFADNETSAAPLVRALRRAMREGCGDNSCEHKKPTGIGTNGGCQCWQRAESAFYVVQHRLRLQIQARERENDHAETRIYLEEAAHQDTQAQLEAAEALCRSHAEEVGRLTKEIELRRSVVVQACDWFATKKPVVWLNEEHRKTPHVNCATEAEKRLAQSVAAFIDELGEATPRP